MKKKIPQNVITTLFLAILIVGCSDDNSNEPQSNFVNQQLPYNIIYDYSQIGAPPHQDSTFVISTEAEWQSFLTSNSPFLRTDRFTTTNINFLVDQVVVAIDSTRFSDGYIIRIDSIVERQNDIAVYLKRTGGGPGDIVVTPIVIAAITANPKPVTFEN
jgi:hypothetical protein